jgi:hypothetical protein
MAPHSYTMKSGFRDYGSDGRRVDLSNIKSEHCPLPDGLEKVRPAY